MSIIAAGTTTNTALVNTGNTDGTLQLQVNGTTPSVTLATTGAVGVGSTPGYGTNGQVLTSSGSSAAPTWTTAGASLTTPSFTSTIGVGGATASASGAGVTFPATQSASSDANTLDDYEEGTFTPSITASGVTAYSVLEGKYTKIGQVVVVNVKFRVSTSSGGTGTFNITNAPFSQTATFQASGSARESGLGTGFLSSVWMASSSTDIYVSDALLSGSYGYAFTLVYHV